MPINLNKAEAEALGKLNIGESKDKFELFVATNILQQYAKNFADLIQKNIRDRKIVGSGDLEKNIRLDISDDGKEVKIYMLDYYDYVNEGVKGWGDNKNAPNSPYQYRSKGMDKKGRDSIKKYILSGKAKVKSTKNDIARGIGLESKGIKYKKKKTLIESQVNSMVWLIKKYGIKRTDYFNDAFETAFAGWEQDIGKALSADIKLSIIVGNKNDLNKRK